MYIPPFILGVVATIVFEIGLLLVIAISKGMKK